MAKNNDELICEHYRAQAEKDGSSPLSTISDQIIRDKEVELIKNFVSLAQEKKSGDKLMILDAGCGNGYTLTVLSENNSSNQLFGLEFTRELLAIAQNRNIPGCVLDHGDVRDTPYQDSFFDLVYTERCLINILDYEQQKKALKEIARILKPNGYYLMIECFTDGLENNNKARQELGLNEIESAYHNLYFDKNKVFDEIRDVFRVVEPAEFEGDTASGSLQSNFLSSHYFVARVLHPLVTKGEWIRNTEFVKFFSFLPPVGNYAPIQAYVLVKPASNSLLK